MASIKEKTYENLAIEGFRKEILLGNICKVFLPVSIEERDGETIVQYYAKGLIPLKTLKNISTLQLMELVIDILSITVKASDNLMFIEDYILKLDYLYVTKDLSKMSIMFVPRRKVPLEDNNLETAIEELKILGNENGEKYIDMVIEYINDREPDQYQLEKFVDNICQEIYQCAIE